MKQISQKTKQKIDRFEFNRLSEKVISKNKLSEVGILNFLKDRLANKNQTHSSSDDDSSDEYEEQTDKNSKKFTTSPQTKII
jgi:hypothetical protein